jgi:hypothetical protein
VKTPPAVKTTGNDKDMFETQEYAIVRENLARRASQMAKKDPWHNLAMSRTIFVLSFEN